MSKDIIDFSDPKEVTISKIMEHYDSMKETRTQLQHALAGGATIADASFIIVIDKMCINPIFEKGKVKGCSTGLPNRVARFTKPSAEYYASITHNGNPKSVAVVMHWKDATRMHLDLLEDSISIVEEYMKKEGLL